MSTDSFNGVATPAIATTHTTGTSFYTDGETPPNARVAANGARPVLISQVRLYLAGYLEAAQVQVQFGTANTITPFFYAPQAAIAQDTGWQPIDAYFANGSTTTQRLTIKTNVPLVFGRGNGAGGTTIDSVGNSWNGGIAGTYIWAQAPSAPRAVAARPDSTAVFLNWATPDSDGDSPITDYIIQYSTSSTFATGITQLVTNSTVTSYTVSGLTGANRYYFRIAARNAVTNRAQTWSVFSETVTSRPLSGGNGTDLDPGYSLPAYPGGPAVYPSNNVLDVFWSTPLTDGGVPIQGYQLQVSTDSGFATPQTFNTSLNTLNYTVGGLLSNTAYYVRIRSQNAIGYSAWTAGVLATTPGRATLDAVGSASIHIDSGIQVELRTSVSDTPVIQLGYIALTAGSTFTVIDTVATGSTNGLFSTYGNLNSLIIVADPSGNLYLIGRNGGTNSGLLVKQYIRNSTTSWTLNGSASQNLTDNGQPIIQFAAEYMRGTTDSILVLTRRAGPYTSGNLSFATVNPAMVAANNGPNMLIAAGTDPTFFPAPPTTSQNVAGTLDTSKLSDTRAVIVANGFAVVDVLNGVVSGVAKSPDQTDWYGDKIKVYATAADTFSIFRAVNGQLNWYIGNTVGQVYLNQAIGGSYANGGWSTNWDAYLNQQNKLIYVYFVPNSAPNLLYFLQTSPETHAFYGVTQATQTLGAAGSINSRVRLPQGTVDERKVVVETTNTSGSTVTLISYVDTSANLPPRIPAINKKAPFDSDVATTFTWSYGDYNFSDVQGSYQFTVDLQSTGANVYDSGRVYSSTPAHTIPAGALDDEINYRWHVRVYDALGTMSDWSTYGYVRTADAGQVTITSPAATTTVSTDYVDVSWVVGTTSTTGQSVYKVDVVDTSTGNTVFSTGFVTSHDQNYRVQNLVSGTTYSIQVTTISDANIQAVTGTRTVTASYSAPTVPVFSLVVYNEFIRLSIQNPDDGKRPKPGRNDIYRRETGSGNAFVKIGSTRPNTDYLDYAVGSGIGYDYKVRSVSVS